MLGFVILWPWLGGSSPERRGAGPFLPTGILGVPVGLVSLHRGGEDPLLVAGIPPGHCPHG